KPTALLQRVSSTCPIGPYREGESTLTFQLTPRYTTARPRCKVTRPPDHRRSIKGSIVHTSMPRASITHTSDSPSGQSARNEELLPHGAGRLFARVDDERQPPGEKIPPLDIAKRETSTRTCESWPGQLPNDGPLLPRAVAVDRDRIDRRRRRSRCAHGIVERA